MIPIDKAVIARLDSQGFHFEVLVEPHGAWKLREGEPVKVEDIVAVAEVFKDSTKGDKAGIENVKKVFGTTEFREVTAQIIKRGEVQLTTQQKSEMKENKKKQIIAIFCREAIDPRTKAPIPPARLEKAMEEAKVHVDPFKPAAAQVEAIHKQLMIILPMKFAKARIAIKIPAEYSGKAYGTVHGLKMLKEEWGNDGSFMALVEIPAGMQGELYEDLNRITHGKVEAKLVSTE